MHMSNCRNINYGSRNSAQHLAPLPSKGGSSVFHATTLTWLMTMMHS